MLFHCLRRDLESFGSRSVLARFIETTINRGLIDCVGCMAALDAEHYLQEIGSQQGKSD